MTLTCTNVTLRQKPLRNDRISLYLDYYPAIRNPYTMKMSRREFLGIYIYAKPKNEQQRMFNQDMLNKAEAIRCIRVQSLINEEFGFLVVCWEDIVDYSAGGKCVHIITQKNKAEDIIPISEEALGLIGYNSEKKGLVFKGLMRSWTQIPMKEWIRSAGITKNITFHSYRRTFATLQAAAGTDIRTIQSIMAHKSITTTQRYIKVVDANKREASKKITLTRQD